MGSGLVQHPTAVSWAKAQLCQGPAGKTFLPHSSKGSSGQPCSPASSLRPEADGNQNAAYPWGPATPHSELHIAAPAPQASSLLWAGPSSQRQEWLGPLGEPRGPAQSLPARAGLTMAPFTRERSWPIWSLWSDVPGPGTKSGKSEAQEGVAKTGRVRDSQQSTSPHTHSTHTISWQGDYRTAGRPDSLGPWGWRGGGK